MTIAGANSQTDCTSRTPDDKLLTRVQADRVPGHVSVPVQMRNKTVCVNEARRKSQ